MRDENPYVVLLTCVLSHVSGIPYLRQFYKRRWAFEGFLNLWAYTVSFMYHFCQALNVRVFLDELQWHRLDNVGAISCFGSFFLHLCCVKDSSIDLALKLVPLFVALVLQEGYPWVIVYTLAPVAIFGITPVLYHTFVTRRMPAFDFKAMTYGFVLLAAAFPFFVLGLDDDNDPWRIYHGIWHLLGGFSGLYLWRIYPHHPMHADKQRMHV